MTREVNTGVAVAAGILGGGLAAGSHAFKAGSRVLINTSPEPFTNWTASIAEDIAVITKTDYLEKRQALLKHL